MLVTVLSVTLKNLTNLHVLIRGIHCMSSLPGEHRVVCSDGQGCVHRYGGPSETQGQLTDHQVELESSSAERPVCAFRDQCLEGRLAESHQRALFLGDEIWSDFLFPVFFYLV